MSFERGESPTTDRPPEQAEPKILVLDDDQGFRPALCSYLKRFHYRSLEATTIEEGLTLAQAERPDLIMLDLCLDGIGSRDTRSAQLFLAAMKSDEALRSIPIFAMSGIYDPHEVESRFKKLGAEAFLYKGGIFDGGLILRLIRGRLVISQALAPAVAPAAGGFPLELTILVIDDEEDTAELIQRLFKDQPYRISWAADGQRGLSQAATELPDLVILDLHLPGLDGKEICRRLRGRDPALYLPILMRTSDERAEVECLNIGADDYLLKTESIDVLTAKIFNMIRRRRFGVKGKSLLRIGGVEFDPHVHALTIADCETPIDLTKKEAGLVLLLMGAEGRPVSSQELYSRTSRGMLKPQSSTMRAHISHIREKLGVHGRLIQSVEKEDAYRFDVAYAQSLVRPTNGATG